jgi:hypothetical protein
MIAQQELQHLLTLPDQEKIILAHHLLESLVKKQPVELALSPPPIPETPENTDVHPSVKWLLSMAGMYSGGPGDTGERADEICHTEIKRRSGFTLKEELPD